MNSVQGLKICLVANTDWYLYNFRLSLAKTLRSQGWEVALISPPGSYVGKFAVEGFRWVKWEVGRRDINPWRELMAFFRLIRIYKQEKPSLLHHFTIKPVLYGSLASRLVNKPAIVNSITGLGYLFLTSSFKGSVLRAFVLPLYHLALRASNVRVIFENQDDQQTFLNHYLIKENQSTVIEGTGVDITRFVPYPEEQGKLLVVMPARLLWDKGVGVFVEAAKFLQKDRDVRIAVVGKPDPGNPANIDEFQLRAWLEDGSVEFWGFRDDMEEVYRQAHIVCLPSMGEGLPTVLIEAAASGRPIVATDVPGCREVVEHGINGLLVPPNNAVALAQAIATLVDDPYLRKKMGEASRQKAVNEFAVDKIIEQTIAVYYSLLNSQ